MNNWKNAQRIVNNRDPIIQRLLPRWGSLHNASKLPLNDIRPLRTINNSKDLKERSHATSVQKNNF